MTVKFVSRMDLGHQGNFKFDDYFQIDGSMPGCDSNGDGLIQMINGVKGLLIINFKWLILDNY